MKNTKLQICDVMVHPGESANLALPLPERYSCAPLYMPIKVLHGKEAGPCLVVFSTIVGNELNGLEIITRLMQRISPEELTGTVIAIPVLNVYGLTHFPATLPSGNQLTDCFPGSETGNFGERMAHVFTQEILKKADYCIELQTGALNHDILPQVYCNFTDSKARQLAKAFKSPVITNVAIANNKLRQTTEELQVPLLVYKAGEAMRFDENAISVGLEGIINVMRAVQILPKAPLSSDINPIFSQEQEWIVAHAGGILRSEVKLGQRVQSGDVMGTINDPFTLDRAEHVKAEQEGIVVGVNMTPLVHEGLPIFKLATFLDYEKAQTVLEEWDRQQADGITT